jgi:hypothetical protein
MSSASYLELKNDKRDREKPEPRLESSTMMAFGISAARVDTRTKFDVVLNQIRLATDELCRAQSEKQMNFIYKAKTDLILAALRPLFGNASDADQDAYKNLRTKSNTCTISYITSEFKHAGGINEYSFKIVGMLEGIRTDDMLGRCSGEEHERTVTMIEENMYRSKNCEARRMFGQALDLAFSMGLVHSGDTLEIEGTGISSEGTSDYLSKTKAQLGN